MKTDYQKLSLFEIAVIGLIAAGMILIGLIVFVNLGPADQNKLTHAIEVFDLHKQARQEATAVVFLFEAQQKFYEEFYVAFSQVASLPSQDAEFLVEMGHQTALLWERFGEYSEAIAIAYNQANQPVLLEPIGHIAGIVIIKETLKYEPPRVEWRNFKQLLKQLKK